MIHRLLCFGVRRRNAPVEFEGEFEDIGLEDLDLATPALRIVDRRGGDRWRFVV